MNQLRTIVAWMIVVITIIMPLKFGLLTGLPETTSYYPDSLIAWLVICWPAVSFPTLHIVLLI